ncbi:hypothetical protein V6N12_069885 [Hibiscus sabdariffa]|uniref:Hydroxyproline-rich glycoprotein family protein n=1 Tax=Hibiscus sabdariffa TaxID=183260 RepID=A0ABR2FFP9_9ROSI
MAVPSGNVVLSDKMQFPAPSAVGAGGGGGNAVALGGGAGVFNQQHHQNWIPDERDGFICWLRGEFAAANAMIDAICNHLREVGEAGEYEALIACIQQRRCHWNSVLHMQQFFSITEVSYALQQVAWRRRQMHYDHEKVGGKEFKMAGFGFKGHRIEGSKETKNSGVDCDGKTTVTAVSEINEKGGDKCEEFNSCVELGKDEDKCSAVAENRKDTGSRHHADSSLKRSEFSKKCTPGNTEPGSEEVNVGCTSSYKEHDSHPAQNQNEKQNLALHAKHFVGNEMFDGRMGRWQERTTSRQVCLNVLFLGRVADRRIEAIPSLLQDAIERLVELQVIIAKPDSCIIDVYSEGDHSPPRMWPPWFGNPTFVLFLTECDITFGRVIGINHPGDFKGSLKLSLAPGSLLLMEGKSADFAKHALPSARKQCMLVTFTNYQPKKSMAGTQKPPSPLVSQSSQRGPPFSRLPNPFRHSAPKHYAAIPTTGTLPATGIRPPNIVQPLFVPTPVAPAIPFPAPVPIPPGSTGWSAAAQRHFPPHLHIPGTGVFLPPPGSNSLPQHLSTIATKPNLLVETTSPPENDNGSGKPIHHETSPREKCDGKSPNQGCNGSLDEISNGRAVMKEEQQCNDNRVKQPANAVVRERGIGFLKERR